MARVTADDIPTSVTKLVYTCPFETSKAYSQNQVAELLAHYWPAIAEHFARKVHKLKDPAPAGSEHYRSGWDDAVEAAADTIRKH